MKHTIIVLIALLAVSCTVADARTFKVRNLVTDETTEAKLCPCWGPAVGDTVRLGADGIHSGLRETEKGEQYVLLEEVIEK